MSDPSQNTNNAPDDHTRREVKRGFSDPVEEHVGGDLHDDVADVEDREEGCEFGACGLRGR